MHIFVTGATGFIGSHVVKELIAAGHGVTGLCRDEAKAQALAAAGAEVLMGSMYDFDLLTAAAFRADAVIHLAFNHDFSTFMQNCEDDRKVISALGAALKGSDRPLIVTSGTMIANIVPGEPASENNTAITTQHHPRAATEEEANRIAAEGVNVGIVRLPQVHDTTRAGLVAVLLQIAQEKGVFAYVGEGQSRWPAAHVVDVAKLYKLAIEKAKPGAIYHAVAEEGVTAREISETLGQRLNVPVKSIPPEQVQAHFGWFALFANLDAPASSELTQQWLDWHPRERGIIADLKEFNPPSH